MKRGLVVDVETAEKITRELRHADPELRPIIWPEPELAKVRQQVSLSFDSFPIHRPLLHLKCYEDDMDCVACIPRISDGMYFVMIAAREADYDGNFTWFAQPTFWTQHKADADLIRRETGYPDRVFSFEELDDYLCSLPMADDGGVTPSKDMENEMDLISEMIAMETYAFSPYTVIKRRPYSKQLKDPLRRDYPAIEVVNLRLPEVNEDPETTGRSINCRYRVKPHMRRQSTKEGIKLIEIAEHWRGPLNAPVKPKAEKVYKVIR